MIRELKKRIVQAAYDAGEGHIASAFSILDILYVLYNQVLQPEDKFILSKGHSCLALYSILRTDLSDFCQYDSPLGGHPDRHKVMGVTASTGSLGHGFPMAVGIALARKIKDATGRVYVLVGDGECNEGTIWESCLLAAQHKLDNLTLIVDYNHSNDRSINLANLAEKFRSFNFSTWHTQGHNPYALLDAFRNPSTEQPQAIVAETTKGYGVKRMEADPAAWHHRVPNATELAEILEELNDSR